MLTRLMIFITSVWVTTCFAKLSIVTTTADLKSLTERITGNLATVESIAKGTQDPHFIEAKPSYMIKLSKADLLISNGLDLEVGWLPLLVQGSRNPKISKSKPGYLELGELTQAIDIPHQSISRADGDVHPLGNPHFTLDPERISKLGYPLAKRLSELDPPNASQYEKNAKLFQMEIQDKFKDWKERLHKTGIKKIITYHKTLNYFLKTFGIDIPIILEPKPGIPPTSSHLIEVIKIIKAQNIKIILIENYFDSSVMKKLKEEVPQLRIEIVPVSVEGDPKIKTLMDLYENLVKVIEGKA